MRSGAVCDAPSLITSQGVTMKNKGRVKLLFWVVLMGASSGLVVKVGILELVTLILLFCGMLHLTRGLEERGDENQEGVENNKVEHRW